MKGHGSDGAGSEHQQGRLVIVCGLPGSGKTTLAKKLCANGAAVCLSPDDWMEALGVNLWNRDLRAKFEALQWQISQDLLSQGITVVIEWGTWAKVERDTLRVGARNFGPAVELWYLGVGIDELWNRVSTRQMEHSPMSRQDLEQCFAQFEVPDEAELALFDPH
jgi:predicted kinase